MKILNFVPLLVWACGFLWLDEWTDYWRSRYGGWTKKELYDSYLKTREASSKMYCIGIIFWLIVGMLCS